MAKELFEMGCYEISLGDTIGVGTPGNTKGALNFKVFQKFSTFRRCEIFYFSEMLKISKDMHLN